MGQVWKDGKSGFDDNGWRPKPEETKNERKRRVARDAGAQKETPWSGILIATAFTLFLIGAGVFVTANHYSSKVRHAEFRMTLAEGASDFWERSDKTHHQGSKHWTWKKRMKRMEMRKDGDAFALYEGGNRLAFKDSNGEEYVITARPKIKTAKSACGTGANLCRIIDDSYIPTTQGGL